MTENSIGNHPLSSASFLRQDHPSQLNNKSGDSSSLRQGPTDFQGINSFGRSQARENPFDTVLQRAYQSMRTAFSEQNQRYADKNAASNSRQLSPSTTGIKIYPVVEKSEAGPITSQQASDTILGFMSNRLNLDVANGATQEELLSRLDAGKEGFIKGFNEAKDIIESLGMMTDKLASEINETYERVTAGVEQLRDQINDLGDSTTVSTQLTVEKESTKQSEFSLQLTTQDGDKVSIQVNQKQQNSLSFNASQSGNQISINGSRSISESFQFELNVVGELDDGERKAIDDLLKDVGSLASDFYSGRYDQAVEQANQLNLDFNELSSLDLNLKQQVETKAIATYQNFNQESLANNEGPAQGSLFNNELFSLLDQVNQLLDNAKGFKEPLQLIDAIAAGLNQAGLHQDKPPVTQQPLVSGLLNAQQSQI